MRFSASKQLHINDHLKAHLGYKFCPRTLGTEDLVYGGTDGNQHQSYTNGTYIAIRTPLVAHRLRVWNGA